MERCLLVGGPHDGKWRAIDATTMVIEVNDIPPVSCHYPPTEPMEASVTIRRVLYQRQPWKVGAEDVRSVFVAEGMTPAQLFDALLRCYGQQAEAFAEKQRIEQELKDTQRVLAACNHVLQAERAARTQPPGKA